MTNLGDIYNQTLNKLGKDAFGGVLSPDKFNEAIDYVNLDKFNDSIRLLEINQNMQEDLRPFSVTIGDNDSAPLVLTDAQEHMYGALPTEFVRWSSGRNMVYANVTCTTSRARSKVVEMLQNSDFWARLGTRRYYPSEKRPIATIQDDRLLVAPKGLSSINMTYLRFPITPVFDYNLNAAGDPVYLPPNGVHDDSRPDIAEGTPSSSVEFEWHADTWIDIINRLYAYMAINIKSNEDLQTVKIDEP
jgi:hypothetical protein